MASLAQQSTTLILQRSFHEFPTRLCKPRPAQHDGITLPRIVSTRHVVQHRVAVGIERGHVLHRRRAKQQCKSEWRVEAKRLR